MTAVPPDFERTPLLPAIVQDARTGRVRMLGYMDREAFDATCATGELHLHSRSRGRLWRKGETSGHVHPVRAIASDCDGDALLVLVEPVGPTCHLGNESCFVAPVFSRPGVASGAMAPALPRLEERVRAREAERPEGSYTAGLLAGGVRRVAQKVGEEAVETVVAALAQDGAALVAESADLLYHLVVLWIARGVGLADVLAELSRREERRA